MRGREREILEKAIEGIEKAKGAIQLLEAAGMDEEPAWLNDIGRIKSIGREKKEVVRTC